MEDVNVNTNANVKPVETLSLAETLFAWVSLVGGYLFCRVSPVSNSPLGGFLLILALFLSATVTLKTKGIEIKMAPFFVGASAVVMSLTLVITSNPFLYFFAYSYAFLALLYYLYSATGNRIKEGFNGYFGADFIKILFVMPFASFSKMVKAILSGKTKNGSKTLGKIILGLLLALVPTAIVIALLCYDKGFSDIMEKIFDFDFKDVMSHIGSFILGIPLGMYFYGLFFSSVNGKCRETVTEHGRENLKRTVQIAPEITVAAAVLPLLFVYTVFFVSQWQYYMSGFTGVLPQEFSYAEYAREGFFQLCVVSVINLLIIIGVSIFIKRKDGKTSIVLEIVSLLFSIFTLVLIATAMSKLYMYVDCYGLTRLRLYAGWFMLLIAVVFVIIGVKQFVPKINSVALSGAVTVAMFAILALSNVDGFIAKYNVDRYLDGSIEQMDVYTLSELGDAAIPEMVRLYKNIENSDDYDDGLVRSTLKSFLYDTKKYRFNDESVDIFARNIPYILAEKAINEINFEEE